MLLAVQIQLCRVWILKIYFMIENIMIFYLEIIIYPLNLNFSFLSGFEYKIYNFYILIIVFFHNISERKEVG
jgi:hypothetical protein